MKKIIFFSLLSFTALTACARAKQELGLTRRTPDEFAVVKRAPLEMPPNLAAVGILPTPQPGQPRPQEVDPSTSAQTAILGSKIPTSAQASAGETALLQRTHAQNDDPNIRKLVDKESVENADKNRPVYKRILNFGNKQDPGPASVVDAPAEAARIKDKKSEDTPSIEQ